ncbi:MAG: PKD-like domain-containing protein [Bacteroidia bacterium]
MKKILLILLLFVVNISLSKAQGNTCGAATPFCGNACFPNNTTTTAPVGPSYGCVLTQPNPEWFIIKTTAAGVMTFTINQNTGGCLAGPGIDVDFVCWGPYATLTNACSSLTGSCITDHNCSGQIEDCSYSIAAVETMTIASPAAGQYYVVMITNYSGLAGYINFTQNTGPATDCSITCPSVLSGPGFLQTNGTAMPASVACNSGPLSLIASNNTPFGNPITPGIMISFNANNNASNQINWFENGTFILCSGPAAAGCSLPISPGAANDIQYSTMSPSATNVIQLCESNTAQPNTPYTLIDVANGAVLSSGIWNDDGACQSITIPPGTITGVATWSVSPACPGCLVSTTDWGFTGFSPAAAGPGTWNICYSFDPPGTCPTYNYCQSITVTNPYTATWTPPAAMCSTAASVNLNALVTGTAGGTWSGTGVTGSTFNPSGLNGVYAITYTVGALPCGAQSTQNITVNPVPAMTSTNTATICSGGTVNIPLTSSSGATYTWIAANNPNTTGESTTLQSTSTINNTITNTTGVVQTVTYTVTPTGTSGGCVGSTQTVTVTINPVPSMTSSATATICSGGTVNIPLTSSSGATYTWIATNNPNTTGESTTLQSTSTLNNTITNTTGLPQIVTYTVTPTGTTGGCAGTAQTVNVTVNPVPAMTSAGSATICSGGTVSIPLTSSAASSYTWIATDNPNTTGESTTLQSTGTLSNTITNLTGAVQIVTYTVTPTASSGGCTGPAQTVTVTVNPTPTMTSSNTATICSGATLSITLTSSASSSYTWIATNNPNTTGESTTLQSSGTINNTLINTTGAVQVVSYTVTPTATTGGCTGPTQTVNVTVNPVPTMTSATTATICSGGTVNIPLTSSSASTYTWIATNNPNTTGESTTLQSTSTINNTIVNPTGAVQVVSYTVTPTATTGGCAGTPQTVSVTVNPMDNASFTYGSSTYCQTGTDPTATITGLAGGTFSSTGGLVFLNTTTGLIDLSASTLGTYTVTYTTTGPCPNTSTVNITITSAPSASFTYSTPFCQNGPNPFPAFGAGASAGTFSAAPAGLNFVNVNTGQINLATSTPGTYTVTNNIAASGGCASANATFSVTINPAPVISASPASPSICSGSSTGITLSSSLGGTTYSWTVSQVGTSGASASSGSTIGQILTTTGPATGTATYTVTSTSGGCAGNILTIPVTVNPIPNVTATPVATTICSGNTASISMTSNVAGATFSWTVSQTGASGATAGSGSTISQVLNATGVTSGSVTYTITPSANGCTGTPVTVTITVNPVPFASASPSPATICSGATTSIVLSSFTAGTTYTWTATNGSGITGASGGAGTPIAQTLANSLSTTGTATYTVTPSAAGCLGTTFTVTVNVNPVPNALASPSSQNICSGGTTSISLSGSVAGTTFAWGAPTATNATGGSAGSGTTIAQTLTATTTSPGTMVYTVTPTANSCPGTPITVTVTVNPNPVGTATPSSMSICSGGTTAITLSSSVAGSTFGWTASSSGTTGASGGSGSSINQTITTTGTTSGTATYNVTVTTPAGCTSTIPGITVTVNPIPSVTASPAATTICSGTTTSIPLTSNVAGATFSWTVTQTGASGASAGSGTSISQTLSATGTTPGTVVYTISSSATGCGSATPATVTITVNPLPVATATPPTQTLCTGSATSIALSSNLGATTFAWTAVQTNVTGAAAGSGSSISQLLNLTGATAGTVVYTVTPTDNGCSGTPITVTINVNPIDNPSFSYSSSTFCQTGADPSATITGLAGGTFTATPAGLVINSSTGMIDVSASTLGTYSITYQTNGPCPNNSSISVTITTAPSSAFSYTSPVCSTDSNPFPSFGAGASAGQFTSTAGLTVNINTGEIDLTTSTPGTYTVTNSIAAAGGCAATSSTATITISPAATVDAGSAASVCEGGVYTLAGAMGGSASTITWTTSGTGSFGSTSSLTSTYTPSAGDVAAGSVVLTITTDDPAGACPQVTDFMVLTVTPLDNAGFSYSGGTFCQTGPNPVPAVTGLPGGTFSSTPAGLVFVSTATGEVNLGASTLGTYNVIYTTNGACPSADTVALTITLAPSAAFSYATPFCQSGTDPVPTFNPGSSAGVFSSTAGLTFVSTSTGQIDLSASTPGTYTVTNFIAAAGGCAAATATFTIVIDPAPTVNAGNDTTICAGTTYTASANMGGSASNITWTTSGTGTFDNTSLLGATYTPSAADTAAGTVTLYIATDDPAGACGAVVDSLILTINPTPGAPAVASTSISSCAGSAVGPITATSTGGAIAWYSDAALTTFVSSNPLNPGSPSSTVSYWVTETYGACQGTATQVTINVNPLPVLDTLSAVIVSANCGDTTGSVSSIAVLSGTSPYTYSWVDTSGAAVGSGANLTSVGPGSYYLTVTDANGCATTVGPFDVISTSGVVASFTANPVSGETPLAVTFTNNSIGAAAYAWDFGVPGSSDTSGMFSPTFTYIPLGQYTACLIATSGTGCADTACTNIDIYINSVFIIPNVFTPNGDNVNDVFMVNAVGLETLDAEIYNRWGQMLYEWHTTSGGWDGRTASGVEASDGTYFYIIKATGFDKKEYFEKGPFTLIRSGH